MHRHKPVKHAKVSIWYVEICSVCGAIRDGAIPHAGYKASHGPWYDSKDIRKPQPYCLGATGATP